MPATLKFREFSVVSSRWNPLGRGWEQTGSVIRHQGTTPQKSFNFFVNDHTLHDGALEATVRLTHGQNSTGRLLFRYTPKGCYYAGIGGYNSHFVIAKFIDVDVKKESIKLASSGRLSDIRFDEPYELRVEFVGEHIMLKSNGVPVLEATDTWFTDGNIGVNCFKDSVVEFSNFCAFEVPPIGRLVQILDTFPHLLKRDYAYLKRELQDEGDVQRILWTMLRTHYPDLIDEEFLCKFGLKHYKDDFGIPSLATIVEAKVVKQSTDLKRLQEEMMVDVLGYFASPNIYRNLVFFIYNMANRLIDNSLVTDLLRLDPVAAVVIVPGITYP